MDAYIIVATKGRAKECGTLLDFLAKQTVRPKAVVFIGVDASDTDGISRHPEFHALGGEVLHSERASSAIQRNVGIDHLIAKRTLSENWFMAFFDDDYRPDVRWIESARDVFSANANIAALTGQVLADGIMGPGISEADAASYIEGTLMPMKCWAQGETVRPVDSVYGCNMAARDVVFTKARFDERLPLYAWQEDRDFTSIALQFGEVIYHPAPRGVHLGAKSARTSGKRMGYSQIANMVYLRQKGSVTFRVCTKFLFKALAANTVKSITNNPYVDYRGRLRGNLVAIGDAILGRMKPERILSLK